MNSAQYRAALDRLGLTQAEAAEILGKSIRTSNGYANGKPIPVAVAFMLDRIVGFDDDGNLLVWSR